MGKKSEFHIYLKDLRLRAALSQEAVAHALGYESSQFISNWERGLSHPPLKAVPTLAQIYQVSIREMYEKLESAILKDLKSSLRKRFEKI
ncbi:hypothetical protein AZI86_16440 [Bdellovibrio bacteriovorus]|uniref:HTH cro/C1-type domain-containing protein n=1 Tax=Bdellovibrio bacteriovorus TaxID=959 RepID=A0A150WHG7_BDEBC|nr:helix-turn-helix transcriptional regulator [Bdellovibrio bacteriovorus]KYG62420.1 hypothetical protein AZI86_16440 [Bdellovibrio bacteriovorus]